MASNSQHLQVYRLKGLHGVVMLLYLLFWWWNRHKISCCSGWKVLALYCSFFIIIILQPFRDIYIYIWYNEKLSHRDSKCALLFRLQAAAERDSFHESVVFRPEEGKEASASQPSAVKMLQRVTAEHYNKEASLASDHLELVMRDGNWPNIKQAHFDNDVSAAEYLRASFFASRFQKPTPCSQENMLKAEPLRASVYDCEKANVNTNGWTQRYAHLLCL